VIDRLITAEAAWLGAQTLAGPTAVGIRGRHIRWIGPLDVAPSGVPRTRVDGVLLPGLTDHHVHSALIAPDRLLAAGVTTVVDLGWTPGEIWTLAQRSRHDPALPHIRAAGPFLTAPGGYPTRQEWAPPGIALEVEDPYAAAHAVDSLLAHRPVTIKVALNAEAGPVVDDFTLRAIVRTATAHRIPVTAHVQGAGQTLRAVRAGVQVLAHTPWTEVLDSTLIAELAQRMTIISTIDIHGWGKSMHARDIALHNLRRFHAAGGAVRYGTDLGNGSLPQTVNAREITALTEAELDPVDILRAITGTKLRIGAPASLCATPTDPTANPAALQQAVPVSKAGQAVVVGDVLLE
jgi:imidazolonepropionase-like amidohydrolase